jgi:hypothetical protein
MNFELAFGHHMESGETKGIKRGVALELYSEWRAWRIKL